MEKSLLIVSPAGLVLFPEREVAPVWAAVPAGRSSATSVVLACGSLGNAWERSARPTGRPARIRSWRFPGSLVLPVLSSKRNFHGSDWWISAVYTIHHLSLGPPGQEVWDRGCHNMCFSELKEKINQ